MKRLRRAASSTAGGSNEACPRPRVRSTYNVSSRLDGIQITGKALLKLLRGAGCEVVRQTGSHVRVRCGDCFTTVPVHAGETLPVGTLKQIERDLGVLSRQGLAEPSDLSAMECAMKKYRAVYKRDPDGRWIVTIPRVKGCHTYGRTIDQARERVREALSLYVDDARHAVIEDDVRLPSKIGGVIRRAHTLRARVAAARAEAESAEREAVATLRRDLKIGHRDAGTLLGLSHQRVHQIEHKKSAR